MMIDTYLKAAFLAVFWLVWGSSLNDQTYTAWDGHFEGSESNQNVHGPMRRELGQVGHLMCSLEPDHKNFT